MWWFSLKHNGEDSASAGRDNWFGARLDNGKGQNEEWRLNKSEELDRVPINDLADPSLSDFATQTAIVEALEREYNSLPEEVKREVAGDLTVARNALNSRQKVPAMTISRLAQAKNDQETKQLMQSVIGSAFAISGQCGICGGESVSPADRVYHGLGSMFAAGMQRAMGSPFAGMRQ